MQHRLSVLGFVCASQALLTTNCLADTTSDIEKRLEALEKAVQEQQNIISGQQRVIDEQQQKLSTLSPMSLQEIRGAGPATPTNQNAATAPAAGGAAPSNGSVPDKPVGQAPEQEQRPQVAVIPDVGGVLTPKGHLVIEPSVQYVHTSNNQLTFRGVSLQDTVLIGIIEASDADRDLISPALTARYGVTRNFEVETKIPYVYRSDRLTFLIPQAGQPDLQRQDNLTGSGLGDIEVAAHYQITDSPPYLVGNLRLKTTTGEGPFDIDRDSQGVDEELPTGSGFYGLEPSMTILWPTDPAVLFGTISYQWNIASDVNTDVGEVKVGHVDPGDSVGIAVGMGFAVNDDFSFSLGFKYNYYFKTTEDITTTQNGVTTKRTEKSNTLQLGSLLFGMGYRITPDIGVNLDMEIGVTSDAPDMQATLRVPVSFDIF